MDQIARSFTVTTEHGCKVLRGWVTLQEAAALLGCWSDEDVPRGDGNEWIVDARLGELVGAVLVAGPRSLIEAWGTRLGRRYAGKTL